MTSVLVMFTLDFKGELSLIFQQNSEKRKITASNRKPAITNHFWGTFLNK